MKALKNLFKTTFFALLISITASSLFAAGAEMPSRAELSLYEVCSTALFDTQVANNATTYINVSSSIRAEFASVDALMHEISDNVQHFVNADGIGSLEFIIVNVEDGTQLMLTDDARSDFQQEQPEL